MELKENITLVADHNRNDLSDCQSYRRSITGSRRRRHNLMPRHSPISTPTPTATPSHDLNYDRFK